MPKKDTALQSFKKRNLYSINLNEGKIIHPDSADEINKKSVSETLLCNRISWHVTKSVNQVNRAAEA